MVRTSQKPPAVRKPDTGVWPCTLDGCSKVFAREADLKRHQRTTKSHSIPGSSVGSPCPLCDATFTRSDAMRRHLKSRHGGKTPETLTVQETQASASSAAREKRRAYSPEDASELSGSDGERGGHSRTVSSSRAPSAAPSHYYNAAAPPPLPQTQQNLSPAILYQAAMHATSYEIQHALSPRPSATSSPSLSSAPPTSVTRHSHESNPSRRAAHPPGPMQPGYQQFPPDDYYGQQQQSHSSQPSYSPYGPPPSGYTTSGESAMYGNSVYARNQGYVPAQSAAGSRSPFRSQEPPPSGLAALAMHASQIRPLSPLPKQNTKSELESALGPPYAR